MDGSRFTQVFVVTTTMRMVNRVHPYTSHNGESLSLALELVVKGSSLHYRFLVATTSCNEANGGTAATRNSLSLS